MDYISANIANEHFMVYAVNMQLPRAIYMYRQIPNISRTFVDHWNVVGASICILCAVH